MAAIHCQLVAHRTHPQIICNSDRPLKKTAVGESGRLITFCGRLPNQSSFPHWIDPNPNTFNQAPPEVGLAI
jgi:hypothetical protein